MEKWQIGCSGFYYNHWRDKFYPPKLPKSKWFAYYLEHFSTLELNVTFYRFPKLEVFQNWHFKTPDHFTFSVKAPRLITHYKQFLHTAGMMSGYYSIMKEGLRDKLACVLFQLPPRFSYSPEKLDRILLTLDPRFQNVLEFRHESWWNDHVYTTLSAHNITFCGMSHPCLPDELVQNTPFVYYRFHGKANLYRSSYSTEELQRIADGISNNHQTKNAFLYFNNDADGAAFANARELINYVKS